MHTGHTTKTTAAKISVAVVAAADTGLSTVTAPPAELERPVVREHKVNRFNEMPPELKARVAARWEGFTKAWGYDW